MKINPVNFYKSVYGILENVTPLKFDCGSLCDHICCQKTDAGEGMYLYPYERLMYGQIPSWADISESDLYVTGQPTPFFSCNGNCERSLRPLACRIFPLVPYIDDKGRIKTILDPRSIGLCPLSEKGTSEEFKKAVHTVSLMLVKISDIKPFLLKQSQLIDDYIEINNSIFNNWR